MANGNEACRMNSACKLTGEIIPDQPNGHMYVLKGGGRQRE